MVGVEEPDAVECRGLEGSLRYSNMIIVTFAEKKGTKALRKSIHSQR